MTSVRKLHCLIALTCIGGLLPSVAVAQTIVWTDGNSRKIQRKEVTGGPVSTIVQFPSPQNAQYIHYDSVGKKLYYLFLPGGQTVLFQRCNLDGSSPEDLSTPGWGPFALNIESRKLYWSSSATLFRSELDGSESESYGLCCVVTMEPLGDTLYFGTGGTPQAIWRANPDGSNQQLLHNNVTAFDLAFDPVEKKLYAGALDTIVRMNTDGSDYQVLLHLQSDVEQVEVDFRGRKLYWTEAGPQFIRRANLDGTGVEDFVTAADTGNPNFNPEGLTIVDAPAIPALSDWALAAMGVLVLCAGLAVLKKRMKTDL